MQQKSFRSWEVCPRPYDQAPGFCWGHSTAVQTLSIFSHCVLFSSNLGCLDKTMDSQWCLQTVSNGISSMNSGDFIVSPTWDAVDDCSTTVSRDRSDRRRTTSSRWPTACFHVATWRTSQPTAGLSSRHARFTTHSFLQPLVYTCIIQECVGPHTLGHNASAGQVSVTELWFEYSALHLKLSFLKNSFETNDLRIYLTDFRIFFTKW